MREYVLTEKEREIVRQYLKDGTKLYGFYQLVSRGKRNLLRLREDLELLEKILKKRE